MHTILPNKPATLQDTFTHGSPPWATLLERLVLIALGAGVMILAIITIDRSAPLEIIALAALATMLVLASYSRKFRDGSVNFLADSRGLMFPSSSSRQLIQETRDETWLLVPWQDIISIESAGVVIGEEGLRPGLQIVIDSAARLEGGFFSHLHSPVHRATNGMGQLVVRYHSIFCEADKTIALLNEFRRASVIAPD